MSKKFRCLVCGYIHEGETAPAECPICHAKADKFVEVVENEGELSWADEHRLGVAKGVDPEILQGLRDHFTGECSEVGMYLAMSRQADREGYPEIAELRDLQNCSVKWYGIPKPTSRREWKLRQAHARTSSASPSLQRHRTSMPSMTPFTRCARTRHVTEQVSRDFTTDISRNNFP